MVYLANVIAAQSAATTQPTPGRPAAFARFPARKTIDEFDFAFQPSIDKKLVHDLATLRFVKEGRPILFLGQPGCGKSHLATALAILAVEAGYRGYFSSADELVRNLGHALLEGTFDHKLRPTPPRPSSSSTTSACSPWTGPKPPPSSKSSTAATRLGNSTIVTTNRGLPKAHRFGRRCARWRLKRHGLVNRCR